MEPSIRWWLVPLTMGTRGGKQLLKTLQLGGGGEGGAPITNEVLAERVW